ncbi:MAG: hypothetical protein ACQEQN_06655, partial [Thermodesulfobacteriota bacterium]
MKYPKILLIAVMVATAAFTGCGSDSGSSGSSTIPGQPGPEVGAQYVGDVNCINCHADQTREWL